MLVNGERLRDNVEVVEDFMAEQLWPVNSPDLFPIENDWAILQDKDDEVDLKRLNRRS